MKQCTYVYIMDRNKHAPMRANNSREDKNNVWKLGGNSTEFNASSGWLDK